MLGGWSPNPSSCFRANFLYHVFLKNRRPQYFLPKLNEFFGLFFMEKQVSFGTVDAVNLKQPRRLICFTPCL